MNTVKLRRDVANEVSEATCLNCNAQMIGAYCHECGQQAITKRLNISLIVADTLAKVFNFEKGYIFTFKELCLHPEKVIKEYIVGKRIKYADPIKFLFVSTALVVIILQILPYPDNAVQASSKEAEKLALEVVADILRYLNLIIIASIPLLSAISYLLYRKKEYNFTEHLVLNSFLYSQTNCFMVLLSVIVFIYPPSLQIVLITYSVAYYIYFGWMCRGLFRESVFKTTFKVIVYLIISIVLIWVVFLCLFALIFFNKPEFQQIFNT